MNQKIKDRELDKRYLAIVEGAPKPPKGSLKGYLFKDAKKNRVFVTDTPQTGAKTCQTNYITLASKAGLSLVECELITGRTHQIRAQFAHAATRCWATVSTASWISALIGRTRPCIPTS